MTLSDLCFLENYSDEIKGFIYSHIDWQKNTQNKITFYFSSYREICDRVYNSIIDDNDSDAVMLPLLFLVRHTIELGMKEFIFFLKHVRQPNEDNFDKVFGRRGKGHNLSNLYASLLCEIKCYDTSLNKNLEKTLKNITIGSKSLNLNSNIDTIENYMYQSFKDSENNFFEFLKEFVDMLSTVDVYNDSFRYATDKNNNKSLANISSINISIIYGLFLQITPVLDINNLKENIL